MSPIKQRLIPLLLCFFMLVSAGKADELSPGDQDYIVINLGENCSARGALESVDIKQESYPFDSCIVPFSALMETLADDFIHYTNPDYFTPYFDNQSPINKYGVVLAHNFPLVCIGKKENGEDLLIMDPEWRAVLPTVQAKYVRRVERFRAACHSFKKVYFFRYLDISLNKAKQLSALLERLYPLLDFELICVDNQSSPHPPVRDHPRIKYYHYNTQVVSAIEEWKRIFLDANLL